MPMYLARGKLARDAMKALVDRPEDRMLLTTRFLKSIGGRLHYYFFALGDYDIVLMFELPDNVSASVLSMVLTSSGSCTDVETTVLLTMPEAVDAMHRAGEAMGVYKPPGGGPPATKRATKRRPYAVT